MPYRVKLGWKIFSSLSPLGAEKITSPNPFYNIKGGRSFLRTLGGNPRAPYEPITVEPTKNLHHILRPSKTALGVEGKHIPFTIFFDQMQQRLQVEISLRKYSSCICASVKVQEFYTNKLDNIFNLQDIKTHEGLFRLVSELLATITSGIISAKKLHSPPKIFPITQISDQEKQDENTLHRLVEILTRHPIEESAIVNSVLEKNRIHKIDKTLILIDKQGILSYLPPNCTTNQTEGNLQRTQNASSLLEFANAIKQDIKSHSAPKEIFTPIIASSKFFLPDSISSQKMWELLIDEFGLHHELESAESASPTLKAANTPAQHENIVIQQFFKEVSMGDQYNITGQAGAIGPNSKAESNTFNQALQQAASNLDLPALAAELSILRNSMRKQATEIEHDQAIAHIGAAENAAKNQDGAGALEHLKSAGKWAFDAATTIGTTVAATAIQTAIGL